MPYHLRQSRRATTEPIGAGVAGVSTDIVEEIVFGGRGPNGLPVQTFTPGDLGVRYRSRALVNRKRSNQRLSPHLQIRKATGTINVSDDDQYAALERLTEMSKRDELLHLVWTSLADPSRVVSHGFWFVGNLVPKMNLGIGGEMETISYALTLVEAGDS